MLILGIESSCDDTSVALLDCSELGCFVLKEKTASQIDIHKKYGGVVPELAGRAHAEKIVPLIEEVLKTNYTPHPDSHRGTPLSRGDDRIKPDVIAVTSGPGLITGLLVGVEAAKTLSYIQNIPLVSVNHIEGHICSAEINNEQLTINKTEYPALALIASGGHTELIYISEQGKYKRIGATKDDASGECFDKIAKLLGLSYPGGPQISKLAESGNAKAIDFPRPMLHSKDYNFSFSGLKTAALYWLQDNVIASSEVTSVSTDSDGATWQSRTNNVSLRGSTSDHGNPVQKTSVVNQRDSDAPLRFARNGININDFCASFEQAIVDVLVKKTIKAGKEYNPKTIILGGGVSANKKLKETLKEKIKEEFSDSSFLVPDSSYSMDNAAMIAVAGYYKAKNKNFTDWKDIKADPNWKIC